jgi:hypothetical protein
MRALLLSFTFAALSKSAAAAGPFPDAAGRPSGNVLWVVAALLGPLVIVAGLIWLRSRRGGAVDVTFPDVVLGVFPILLALFASGQIAEFTVGPEGVGVKALERAATQPVELTDKAFETQPVNPQELEEATKAGPRQIPEYLKNNVQALKFEIGGSYVPDIMRAYFETLVQNPHFRYFVLVEPGRNRLFGIMDARRLLALTEKPRIEPSVAPVLTWDKVADVIQRNPDFFLGLKGFVSSEGAVRTRDSRVEVLAKLEKAENEWLPVVNDEIRLVGTVDLQHVTAGLVRDTLAQLKGASNK